MKSKLADKESRCFQGKDSGEIRIILTGLFRMLLPDSAIPLPGRKADLGNLPELALHC